jgi:hypothetical protein
MFGFSGRLSLCALTSLVSAVALAGPTGESRTSSTVLPALNVSVFGTGPSVESKVVLEVRRLIGAAYEANVIDQLTTLGYGIEGGMSLCVAKTPWAKDEDFLALKLAIEAIPADVRRTAKSAEFTALCTPRE